MFEFNPPAAFDLQGHRGARGLWPENTLAGFQAAIALGVTSIELDVVLTADGVPVVFHDLALNPDIVRGADGKWLTGPPKPIAALPANALAAFDVGRIRPRSRYAARCRGQTPVDGAGIPTLSDVVAAISGTGVRLDVELKTDRRTEDGAKLLVRTVEAVLGALAVPGVAASLRAFDWRVLRIARQIQPDRALTWLTGLAPDLAAVLAAIQSDVWPDWQPAWAPDHRLLRRRHIVAAAQAGLLVKPWTVNAAFRMRQLGRWGVAGFCTDRPDLAVGVLKEGWGSNACPAKPPVNNS